MTNKDALSIAENVEPQIIIDSNPQTDREARSRFSLNLISKVYSRQFYEVAIPWRKCYSEIASWLWSTFKPKTVIDFGCGNGFIISELKKYATSVVGLEGSINAIDYIPENIKTDVKIADVTRLLNIGKYDLVVSSEVAEHLPERSADVFLSNLTSHAAGIIFFTAAEPGQGGVCHINEQPHEYWIEKFNRKGFIILKDESKTIQKYLKTLWKSYQTAPKPLMWNAMIFKKATKNDAPLIDHQLIVSRIGLTLHLYLLRYLVNARKKAFLRALKSTLLELKSKLRRLL